MAGFVLDAFAGQIPESEADPELNLLTMREREGKGAKTAYFDITAADYLPLSEDPRIITAKSFHAKKGSGGVVASNGSASVLDMGDGAALLEFHSQASTIDADLLEMTSSIGFAQDRF